MSQKASTQTSTTCDYECDLCKATLAQYDGKTKCGPWAYMCSRCFITWGIGLGLGKGQKLVREEDNE